MATPWYFYAVAFPASVPPPPTQAQLAAAVGPPAPAPTVTTPLTQATQLAPAAPGTDGLQPDTVIKTDPADAQKNTSKKFTELPLQSYLMWEAMTLVQQALADHENGIFRSSSLLVDAFGRDDRIAGVEATRVNTIFCLPLTFEPTKRKPNKSKRIADDLKDAWPRMFPQAELRKLLKWGLYIGAGIGELVWDKWTPVLRTWHPQYLYWDWASYQFYIATTEGIVRVTPGDGKWILYTPYGFKYGWMGGLVRALAEKWFYRKFNYRDWARYNEVHGLPIRKAITPADAQDAHQARFATEMAALGTESVIRLPQNGKDQPGYDLQLLEAKADTYGGFVKFFEQIDSSIAITLLGQNLTTSVSGGSFAAAKVHDNVREDLRGADGSTISECLRSQALVHYVRFNYDFAAADDITPKPVFETSPPEDKSTKAVAYQALAAAINVFRQAGVTLDWKKVLTDFGLPVVGMGLDPTSPLPGQGNGNGGDDQGDDKQTPQDKKQANAALEWLSRQPGWKRGQDYASHIASLALEGGAQVIGRDLERVLKIVRSSKSPEDLKRQLVNAYGAMSPKAFAQVAQRAMILARLDGRHAVLEDL